jgi:hypothetical protein
VVEWEWKKDREGKRVKGRERSAKSAKRRKQRGGKGENRGVGIKRCFEWEEGDQTGKGARSWDGTGG